MTRNWLLYHDRMADGDDPSRWNDGLATVTWTPAKVERFAKAIAAADGPTFVFEGATFVPAYARYLLEYLRTHFGMGFESDTAEPLTPNGDMT